MTQTPNFDKLAPVYRWMEYFSFGPWLALTRNTYLKTLGDRRCGVVIGDGDGRFTRSLLKANRAIELDAVDASRGMLQHLIRRAESSRVCAIEADAREWQPAARGDGYDLIATHFFLDCLTTEEAEALAWKLRAAAAPGAIWVISEFAVPAGVLRAKAATALISFLYWCFGWMTGLRVRSLPEYAKALRAAGWTRKGVRSRLAGLLVAEEWSAGPVELPGTRAVRPDCYRSVNIDPSMVADQAFRKPPSSSARLHNRPHP